MEKSQNCQIGSDSDLPWKHRINDLTKKLSSRVHKCKRIKWIGGVETTKQAYNALAESNNWYELTAWTGTSEANLDKNRLSLLPPCLLSCFNPKLTQEQTI